MKCAHLVPELAGRQSMSLVARSKEKSLNCMGVQITCSQREPFIQAVVGTVPEHDSNPYNQSRHRGRLNKHIHREVKCAHLVPELAGRRNMSLVAGSK